MTKYKKRIIYKLVIILILSSLLSACKENPKSEDEKGPTGQEDIDLLSNKKIDGKEDKSEEPSWSDIDGLVMLWKEGEDYYIYYDLEKWEEIHDISSYNEKEFPNSTLADRKLLLRGLHEEIKDAAIVSINGYGGPYGQGTSFPLIFMLMESGGVNWLYGYPPKDEILFEGEDEEYMEEEQYSYGYLPYLGNIESFSYESDGEGIGLMTLYAQAKDGLRYDIRHILDFGSLFQIPWSYPSSDYGGEFDTINLKFWDDGSALMEKLKDEGQVGIQYEGSYKLHLDDSPFKGFKGPIISLDLTLVESPENYDAQPEFKGDYLISEYLGSIFFYHIEGDYFLEGIEIFQFLPHPLHL